jgi:hypothetical protein
MASNIEYFSSCCLKKEDTNQEFSTERNIAYNLFVNIFVCFGIPKHTENEILD